MHEISALRCSQDQFSRHFLESLTFSRLHDPIRWREICLCRRRAPPSRRFCCESFCVTHLLQEVGFGRNITAKAQATTCWKDYISDSCRPARNILSHQSHPINLTPHSDQPSSLSESIPFLQSSLHHSRCLPSSSLLPLLSRLPNSPKELRPLAECLQSWPCPPSHLFQMVRHKSFPDRECLRLNLSDSPTRCSSIPTSKLSSSTN